MAAAPLGLNRVAVREGAPPVRNHITFAGEENMNVAAGVNAGMDINNSTELDTKYKVTGTGGTP